MSPVLVVLVLIWVAVLTPVLLRRLADRESITSVDRFQRGLGVMRSAHPRLVAAAHRSIAIDGIDNRVGPSRFDTGGTNDWRADRYVPARSAHSSAGLADSADSADSAGLAVPDPQTFERSVRGTMPAAHRRRSVLGILASVIVLTFLIGLAPGLRLAWDVSLLGLALLAAYTALVVHFHRIAVERAQKVVFLRDRDERTVDSHYGVMV